VFTTRLQGTRLIHRSKLLSYIQAMKKWNLKFKTKPFTPQNEILRYKSNKIYVRSLWRKLINSVNEIKELNKWREIPCSWIGRCSIIKMLVLLNLIYRFNAVPIKIPPSYFVDINKLIAKFMCRAKHPNSQHSIEGEGQS